MLYNNITLNPPTLIYPSCLAHFSPCSVLPQKCPPTYPPLAIPPFPTQQSPPNSGHFTISTAFLHLLPRSPQTTMSASSFLQIQTRAAHPPRRHQKQPDRDAQVTTMHSSSTSVSSSSSSSSSTESSPSQSPSSSTDWARCSRCHRSVSVDDSCPFMTGVSIGTNSYYCHHCAKVVGYKT